MTVDNTEYVEEPQTVPDRVVGEPAAIIKTGSGSATFEPSQHGTALRLNEDQKSKELVKIDGMCLDFSTSGRMDFRIKFNRDPHKVNEKF